MVNLTIRELFYDKGRLILIILGLTVSMLLIHFGMAMMNGTLRESTLVIDQCESDAWIAQEYRDDVLSDSYISNDTVEEIKQADGIKNIEELIYNFAGFEYDKDIYTIMGYGYRLSSDNLGPWEIIEGKESNLKEEDTIIMDDSIRKKYPDMQMDDLVKVNDVELKVVGFSKNAKWFMSPFGFMSFETARKAMFMPNKTSFLIVNLKDECSFEEFSRNLKDIDDISIYTPDEMRKNTQDFMIYESGMGMGIGLMVVMGIFVALLIIIIMIYSSVKEKIPEFGTLKALGAGKKFIIKMLVGQVSILITISYILGLLVTFLLTSFVQSAMMPFYMEPQATFIIYFLTLGLGLLASMLGVRSVHRIDPAIVFKI